MAAKGMTHLMPRYVILQHIMPPHAGRESHFDLMLEDNGKLITWAIGDLPCAGLQTTATKLPDHRLAYLDYAGPVSGDRGEVRRIDAGDYATRQWSEAVATFELRSTTCSLLCELRHRSGEQWTAEFRRAD
jgi:hypothetical protein